MAIITLMKSKSVMVNILSLGQRVLLHLMMLPLTHSTTVWVPVLSGVRKLDGDVESFGNLTSLITLKIGETVLGGTLESLVKAQVGNGRTSGSIVMGYLKTTNVTFNGVKPNDNEATLTWEPNSEDATKTDITYNGVSVTIDNE